MRPLRHALKRYPKPGGLWNGPTTWCHDYQLVDRPGYYGLTPDGKQLIRPLLRLTCIDDAPGIEDDGACHFEVAGKKDPPARQGTIVPLESVTNGRADVGVER